MDTSECSGQGLMHSAVTAAVGPGSAHDPYGKSSVISAPLPTLLSCGNVHSVLPDLTIVFRKDKAEV